MYSKAWKLVVQLTQIMFYLSCTVFGICKLKCDHLQFEDKNSGPVFLWKFDMSDNFVAIFPNSHLLELSSSSCYCYSTLNLPAWSLNVFEFSVSHLCPPQCGNISRTDLSSVGTTVEITREMTCHVCPVGQLFQHSWTACASFHFAIPLTEQLVLKCWLLVI